MKVIVAAFAWLPAVVGAIAGSITFRSLSVVAAALGSVTADRPDRRSTQFGNGLQTLASNDGSANLNDVHDLLYLANLTVGGTQYTVQLDSGSSDLVLFTGVPNAKPSGLTLNITYGVGYAYGDISTADVSFVDLTVTSQAILVCSSFQNPVTEFGAQGIMGLGFTSLSNIDATVSGRNASWGRTFLYNSFAQSPSEPNYLTFSLIRSPNDTKSDEGGFTIGQVDSDYSAVTSTPSLSTWPVSNPTRWNILIDAYETLSGKATFKSSVTGVSNGQAVLLLDTGTSYVYAPKDMVTAMYQNVPGAKYSESTGQWIVPCDEQVFVGFWIGSRRFDLHPLDLVMASLSDANQCVGTFIPQSLAVGSGEFDILAGDAFLRNVYTLFDFGDFTDSSNLTMGDPYVKLISTTNISSATYEFQKVRGGTSILNVTNPTNSGSGGTSSSPSPNPTATNVIALADLQRKIDHLQNMEPIFFAVLGVNALIMAAAVGLGIWFCCCRRKKGSTESASGGARRPPGRSGRRRGSLNGNTISTMELTTKDGTGTSYAAVSLQNPDGEPLTPPANRPTYEGVPGDRQSTASFWTDPFRHSRTLSGVSALRPMMPAPAGAAITPTGPDPQTPISERGFDAAELTVPPPERARVLSTPNPVTEAYRRQSAMPQSGAMMMPMPGSIERHRHSSSTSAAEQSFNLEVPAGSPSPLGHLGGNNTAALTSQRAFTGDPPPQRQSAMPGMGMPFPASESPSPSSSATPREFSAVPSGAHRASNLNNLAPLPKQVSSSSPLAGQASSYPENDTNTATTVIDALEPSAVTAASAIPRINISS